MLLPRKQAAVLPTKGLFDKTQMYDTNNKRSLGLSEKKCAVRISKSVPALFQVLFKSNQIFNLLGRSTNVSSKLEIPKLLLVIASNSVFKYPAVSRPFSKFTSILPHQSFSK